MCLCARETEKKKYSIRGRAHTLTRMHIERERGGVRVECHPHFLRGFQRADAAITSSLASFFILSVGCAP